MKFENNSWSRIDISPLALNSVETEIKRLGIAVQDFAVGSLVQRFNAYIQAPEYAGDYQLYGGTLRHCFLEKALEHFISYELAKPGAAKVGIDIGSCQSVVPAIVRRLFGARVYEQDLEYPAGVHGDRIGSSADAIPLPDRSVDFMTLHCTFEHFENRADTGFVRECARLLKPGGQTVILPLYLNANYCNITGETDPAIRQGIGFDAGASFHCVIPEWHNRFGRHYSPAALLERVILPARAAGLQPRLLRCHGQESVDPLLWLRWVLILQQPA
jgi:SAM-dependent methyltransferase